MTIKFDEATLVWLRRQARASKKKVGALVREWVEERRSSNVRTVFDLTSDLVGCLEGPAQSAMNERRKFKRATKV